MMLLVVTINKMVDFVCSRNPKPVIGSDPSWMTFCLVDLSFCKSPLIKITVPFANPTAICVKFSKTANVETYVTRIYMMREIVR
jgi:hypothetical protein